MTDKTINEKLNILLDFVERYNKQDAEKEVAEVALTIKDNLLFLQTQLQDYSDKLYKCEMDI